MHSRRVSCDNGTCDFATPHRRFLSLACFPTLRTVWQWGWAVAGRRIRSIPLSYNRSAAVPPGAANGTAFPRARPDRILVYDFAVSADAVVLDRAGFDQLIRVHNDEGAALAFLAGGEGR